MKTHKTQTRRIVFKVDERHEFDVEIEETVYRLMHKESVLTFNDFLDSWVVKAKQVIEAAPYYENVEDDEQLVFVFFGDSVVELLMPASIFTVMQIEGKIAEDVQYGWVAELMRQALPDYDNSDDDC